MEPKGYLSLVLHAHLPYVRHPEHPSFLEEDWLFEAITETYIPLLHVFERLCQDGVPWHLTMSLTPPLLSMFMDPLLQDRYIQHLERLLELADREVERTRYLPEYQPLALMYWDNFQKAYDSYVHRYQRDLVGAFRRFQEQGHLEIIASAATHGYFPLMDSQPWAVRSQIGIGVDFYRQVFHRNPIGFWLPECGFNPPDARLLREFGIRYTFL
ncbi:MAG: DUF1957 domain-containing protein, partial [Firmicutes bacterium]|nr:DUF1957 domain-containing protein [Bacillota bacterium]